MSAILQAARAAYAAGLAPVPTENTGSKAPDVRRWKVYTETPPSIEEMRGMNFAAHDGLGIIAGAGSGYREPWDFDTEEVFRAFVDRAVASGLGALVDRLIQGYLDRTPGGGRRILVEYPPTITFKDVTLARRPGRAGEPAIKTLIELPTFAIVAPSNGRTHPSGGTYERLSGGFDQIAHYTEEERRALFALARTFDQMPRPEARASSPKSVGTRPGDDYNRRTSWTALLESHGWCVVFERDGVTYWRRPGKPVGVSATTNYAGSDLFYPFTSSTVFEPDKSYSKFAVVTWLDFEGDFGRAALALSKEGYGADALDEKEPAPSTRESSSETATTTTTRSLRLTAANTITLRPVRWLWEDRLPVGVFALIGGREGVGKSIFTYTLAADLTNGTLPGVYHGAPKAVIVAATEDSWAHTIVPRLLAAGADLTKVYRADIIDPEGFELPLSLPKDMTALLQAIKDVNAAMVVFDPLLSRLDSRLDSHKDADVRRALEPLAQMADTANVNVLGLIHVNKSTSSDALTLLMGSRAFAAVARAVLFVAVNPDDEEQRVLGQPKNNLGRINLPTLVFQIRGALVQTTADGEEVWTGKLSWLGESEQSLREVLERVGEREEDAQARQDAESWLVDYLESEGGTAARKVIIDVGRQAGHSVRTLTRARQHAKITADGRGFPRQTYWLLPPSTAKPPVGPVGPSEASEASEATVGSRDAGGVTAPTVDSSSAATVAPSPNTSPERGPTGPTGQAGPTEPQLFRDSLSEERWRETDEAFKKGWAS